MKKVLLILTLLLATVTAQAEFPYATTTHETPALEDSITELTFTPYDVYTPNNVQTDPAQDQYKLFDKDRSTKWCVDNSTGSWETIWVDFMSNVPFIPTDYTMTTGDDTGIWPGRNPQKWRIYAKANENDEWTTIVDVTDGAAAGLGTAYSIDYSFDINGVNTHYQYFRFEVSEVRGQGGWQNNHYVFQLAELSLSGILGSGDTPAGDIAFSELEVHDHNCTFNASYTGYESHTLKVYIDGKLVENPHTVLRTLETQTLEVVARVEFKYSGLSPLTASTTYEIPALEDSVLGFIPYAYHTPNNMADNTFEGKDKLFDSDKNTHWRVCNYSEAWETIWVDFMSNVPFIPTGYTMTTGNDASSTGHNPKKWKIYAKAHETDEWTTIVDVTDGDAAGLGTANTTDYSFDINGVNTQYQYFRFEVSEVRAQGGWHDNYHYTFKLAELALSGLLSTEPSGNIVFSELEVHDDNCIIQASYSGNEAHTLKLFVDGTEVENPYTVSRTQETQTLNVVVNVEFTNPALSTITASTTYEVPAQEIIITELAFTPYDVYTPNNVQTDSAENYLKLFDKDRSTKWCVDNSTGSWETIWVDFMSNEAFIPTGYTMTTGNDTQSWQGRNPKKWKIYAKAHENDEWTTIVDVTDGATAGLGTANTTDYNFTIDGVNTPYQYFRFEVSELCGKGGWQNNHYVFQLAELALTGEITTIPEPTPPFVPTPSLMSYPIHWYQLKINDKYVYYNPDATYKVSLTSTESTDDAYLWCFEELAPDSIVIYNKSKKEYMRMGNSLIWTPTASMINYAEPKDETGFYVYYYNGNTKYYHLEQAGYEVLAQTQREDLAQLFNAIEVQVEEDHGEIKEARLIPMAAYTPNNANTNENEDYRKLFDIDKSSKWCVDNSTGSWETIWADFKSKVAFIPTSYTMTTASDTYSWQGRNPKKWKIYAKANETDDWTTIVDVTDGDAEGLGVNGMVDYSFPIDGLSTKYQFFRFEVSEVRGQGGWQNDHYVFQLAELFMSGYTLSTAVSGDANGDNKVDVNDVTAVINYILGKNPTPFNVNNANVNGDAKIDVLDVTLIINLILGIS